jgi:hypothetical protein
MSGPIYLPTEIHMAFKLAQSETYQHEIKFQVLGETGKPEKHHFKATFQRHTNDELEELRRVPGFDVMRQVVKGWSGILDEDGASVPFSEDNLNRLLQIPGAAHALIKGYWDSTVLAPEKN